MDKAHKETDKILDNLVKELTAIYSECYREIEKVYLSNKELLNAAIKNKGQDIGELIKIDRQTKNQLKELSNSISRATAQAVKMLNEELLNIYEINYNYTAYGIEQELGLQVYKNIYNRDIIKKLLVDNENPFMFISLDEMQDKEAIFRELKRKFLVSIVNGHSIEKIAENIKEVVEKKLNEAIRIARTEATRIESMGRQESFKKAEQMGIKIKKVWISTNDRRTRETHLLMQGEEKGIDEKFSNGLEYPGALGGRASEVVNCRCTHVSKILGVEDGKKLKELSENLKEKSFDIWKEGKESVI